MDKKSSSIIRFILATIMLEIGLRMNKTGYIDAVMHLSAWKRKVPLLPGCYPVHLATRLILICGAWFLIYAVLLVMIKYIPVFITFGIAYFIMRQVDISAGNTNPSIIASIIALPFKLIKGIVFGTYNWADRVIPYLTAGLTPQKDGAIQMFFTFGIIFFLWVFLYMPSVIFMTERDAPVRRDQSED